MKKNLIATFGVVPFFVGCHPMPSRGEGRPIALDVVPVAHVINAIKTQVRQIEGFDLAATHPGYCKSELKGYPSAATLTLKTVGTTTVSGAASGTIPIGYVLKASLGANASHAEVTTQAVTIDLVFDPRDFPPPAKPNRMDPVESGGGQLEHGIPALAKSTLIAILNANHDARPCTKVHDVKVEADFQVTNDVSGTATLDFLVAKGSLTADEKRDTTQSVSITLSAYNKNQPIGTAAF